MKCITYGLLVFLSMIITLALAVVLGMFGEGVGTAVMIVGGVANVLLLMLWITSMFSRCEEGFYLSNLEKDATRNLFGQ